MSSTRGRRYGSSEESRWCRLTAITSGSVKFRSEVIRSIVVESEVTYVGAGGGITWLSKADAEAAEVAVKARAPLAALGAAVPAEWAGILESR